MKKRWIFIIIALIVAVVLVIVFVNLFKERDTLDLTNNVMEKVQGGYLDDETEDYQTFENYLETMTATSSEYDIEIKNTQNFLATYSVLGEFYGKQIFFTEYNETYTDHKNNIKDALNDAQETFNNITTYIEETQDMTSGSPTWQITTWEYLRDDIVSFIKNNNRAFSELQAVYEGCVTSKLANNAFSTLVLTTINTYLEDGDKNFGISLDNTTAVALTMAQAYLQGHYEDIMGYQYDTILQEQVNDIQENGNHSEHYNALITGML